MRQKLIDAFLIIFAGLACMFGSVIMAAEATDKADLVGLLQFVTSVFFMFGGAGVLAFGIMRLADARD